MHKSRVDASTFPPAWRIAAGFLLAPLVAAIAIAYVAPLYAGLASMGERIMRSATIYLFTAYLQTIIVGLPAFFILRKRLRPNILNCAMAGGLVSAAPWLGLSLLSRPDYASVAGHVTVSHGHLTWWGFVFLLEFTAEIAAFGMLAGLVFWLVAAADFVSRRST